MAIDSGTRATGTELSSEIPIELLGESGKVKVNPQFDSAGDFSDGLALVAIGRRYGYINRSGNFVINPQFDQGGNFEAGIAPVWVGNREGYIDKHGKYIWNPMS